MTTLNDEWNTYSGHVIPPKAPGIQRVEMRRAFYAGAATMFNLMTQAASKSEGEPTVEEMNEVDAIYKEILTFFAGMKSGKN